MKYQKMIFESLNYIERHIEESITIEVLSGNVGYSVYHFSRIFKQVMGVSPKEYVQERKLIYAAKALAEGEKVIDLAIAYGYETHSGFTKAFKKKFGCTPSIIHALRLSYNIMDKEQSNMAEKQIFIKESVDFKSEEVLYKELLEVLASKKTVDNFLRIEEAYQIARRYHKGQRRKSGEDYIIHPLNVAIILAEMEAEEVCIIAGLLHELDEEQGDFEREDLFARFDNEVIELITEVGLLNTLTLDDLSMSKEKTVLIKIADRLHNMRTIQYMEAERFKEKAMETIALFSPIAAKLGVDKLKMELEDISLKYLN